MQALLVPLPQAVPLGLLVDGRQMPASLHTPAFVQGPAPVPQTVPAAKWLDWQTPAWQVSAALQAVSS